MTVATVLDAVSAWDHFHGVVDVDGVVGVGGEGDDGGGGGETAHLKNTTIDSRHVVGRKSK